MSSGRHTLGVGGDTSEGTKEAAVTTHLGALHCEASGIQALPDCSHSVAQAQCQLNRLALAHALRPHRRHVPHRSPHSPAPSLHSRESPSSLSPHFSHSPLYSRQALSTTSVVRGDYARMQLFGRLVADPEVRASRNGKDYILYTVATKDPQGPPAEEGGGESLA